MSIRSFVSMAGVSAVFLNCFLAGSAYSEPKSGSGNNPPGKNASTAKAGYKTTIINVTPRPLLDTAAVRNYYLDGDFEQAIEILEAGLKEKRPFNHEDSVFTFKHLGVMYAAKYETREKGKYYMHQLLMTEPTARIMDMYASDMIYMIFKNIQDEFESTRGRLARAETHVRGNSQTAALADSARTVKEKKSGGNALAWVGATTAVVAAGVAAYFIFEDEPKTVTRNASFE